MRIGTNDTILDIGCDHGILEAALIERDQAHRVIAADISLASLEKARRLAAELGIEDRVECRLGDGFSVVREDDAIDAAVIAGIGGFVIARLLEEGKTQAQKIGRLILLPSCDAEALRDYLRKSGWACVREELIEDAGANLRADRGRARAGAFSGRDRTINSGIFPFCAAIPLAKKLGKRHLHAMKKALAQLEKEGGSRKRARQIKQSIGGKTKSPLDDLFRIKRLYILSIYVQGRYSGKKRCGRSRFGTL